MCHQAIVILRCGHKSENLSSFDKCRHLLKLQRDEDNKTRLFSRRKKLTNCGNVTTDCRRDDSRVCGACYDKQKQELRAQREREQRAEAKRNEQKSEILRSRVEYDSRERERQQQVEAERQKGMQRDAWRRKAEQEDDQRKRERRAYREEMARQRKMEERQRQQDRRARAERAEKAEREARERREKKDTERVNRELRQRQQEREKEKAEERAREAKERARAEAERQTVVERIAAPHRREREERKRREESERKEREARERRERTAAAEQARQTIASSLRRPAPPPGRLADRRFLSPAAEAKRQQQLRTQMTSPSRPVQRGNAAVPPLRIPASQTQLPVRQRGPQRPVQVVSPIPMHFAQAASVHGGSPSMDWSEPYYAPGPYRRPVDLVDDIVNMYHQRSPTIDISEPFNPGFQQANTANPNLNRNPERHIGLGIHVPSSSQQSSGLRRYYGRPSCLSEHVLEKARAKQSRIPSPPRRKVAFTDTARLTRSKSTKSKASASSSLSGKSKASRPAPVPQGPNPVVAHLQASTDKQHKPTNNSASSLTSIRNVLSRFTSRSNFRGRATPSPLGKLSGMTQRVSGTFNALAGQKSPSPEWVCYDAREIERQARQSLMK